jgi:hypothetical protein
MFPVDSKSSILKIWKALLCLVCAMQGHMDTLFLRGGSKMAMLRLQAGTGEAQRGARSFCGGCMKASQRVRSPACSGGADC